MKVVYVVDSATDLVQKIDLLKDRFGNNILFVVKYNLATLFKTYGYNPNAIYSRDLSKVMHNLLIKSDIDDIVICHASVKFDNNLLNKFISKIGDRSKVVYAMPKYNAYEQMCNSLYNVYVKSLFKAHDCMASAKLQFLPSAFVSELLDTHFSNKLFEVDSRLSTTLDTEDKDISNSLKTKNKFSKYSLIPIIVALVITLGLLITLAFIGVNFIIVLFFVFLYFLDIVLTIIFKFKAYFDNRFLS